MSHSTHRTFDGRVVQVGGEQAPTGPDSAGAALGPLQPFVAACEAVLPETTGKDTGQRLVAAVFMLGACDRFWQRFALDDGRFPAIADRLLQRCGVSPAAAATVATSLSQLSRTRFGSELLAEGAATMDAWLDSHDPNCVLRLTELVVRRRDVGSFLDQHLP